MLSFMPFAEFKSLLSRAVDLAKVGAALTPGRTDDRVVEVLEKVVEGEAFPALYQLIFPEKAAE